MTDAGIHDDDPDYGNRRIHAAVIPRTDCRCGGLITCRPMQASRGAIENPKLLIAIANKGGALAVYGQALESIGYRYKVMTVDQTPRFLDEEHGAPTIERDSGWLHSWSAALKSLCRYPWPQLAGMYVDPAMGQKVWLAIQDYQKNSPRPAREGALARWRQVCGI